MCLDERCGDNNEGSLDEEGACEGSAVFGMYEASRGKEQAAAKKADDRDKGFQPAVWMSYGLAGRAESQEDGITCSRI